MQKRLYKATVKGYDITVKDYGYTSRAPVAVRISGTRLGECVNSFGEPCYYYESFDAYDLETGIKLAHQIASERGQAMPLLLLAIMFLIVAAVIGYTFYPLFTDLFAGLQF